MAAKKKAAPVSEAKPKAEKKTAPKAKGIAEVKDVVVGSIQVLRTGKVRLMLTQSTGKAVDKSFVLPEGQTSVTVTIS